MNRRAITTILLLLLCGLVCSPLNAQLAPQTSNLEALLEKNEGEQRIEILLKLSDQFQRSDVDTAIFYANEALAISKRLQVDFLQGESHRKLGRLLSVNGNNPDGLLHLLKAEELLEETENIEKKAHTLENIGALYNRQSEYQKALEYYFSALGLREQMKEPGDIANTLLNIGIIQERLNQPAKSIALYKRAIKISKEKEDISSVAIIATQLGNLYASIEKAEEGIKYMNEALKASIQLPGEHARATILLSLSSIYKDNTYYNEALAANEEALKLAANMGSSSLTTLALQNIAEIHYERREYVKARDSLNRAIQLLEDGGSQKQVIQSRSRLAKIYLAMESYSQSIEQGKMALDAAKSVKAFELGLESLKILSDVYEQTGDFRKATEVQKMASAFKDSMYSAEQARRIAEMQTRYETEQKEQEIVLLKEEREKERLLRNAFAAGLLFIVVIGFLIYNRQKLKIIKNRTDLENTRLKEKQLERDLEFKNKELTTHSLHMVQKNETMKELQEHVEEIKEKVEGGHTGDLQKLDNIVNYSFSLDKDWEQFRLYFEEVHTGFFDALKTLYPDLTPNELRLSALVKLNLTSKEIATIMGISPDSVKTARYRLRKKLDMETEENLTDFMMDVEKEVTET